MTLYLPRTLLRALWNHAQQEARHDPPRECVGVLGGYRAAPTEQDSVLASLYAQALYPLGNRAAYPEREYLADPGELLRALRVMQRAGLELVGIYHSHPHGPATPSPTDRAQAAYPVPYLIADLGGQTLGAFYLPAGQRIRVLVQETGGEVSTEDLVGLMACIP